MNKITNVEVYGLEKSIIASGYPMIPNKLPSKLIISEPELKRGKKLGSVPSGTGHDCYLKGIIVQFDWTISQVIFPQVERYHFIDIVSSQSKMHRLTYAQRTDFNEFVDPVILERFMFLIEDINKEEDPTIKAEKFNKLVYSCPMGYELTARFTTNYLQLKTIYKQRKNHKLQEWRDFCKWIESLPLFLDLTQNNTLKTEN